MIPGKEQILLENARGGLLRFSGVELGMDDNDEAIIAKVEVPDSSDMESFLMSFNSQEYF